MNVGSVYDSQSQMATLTRLVVAAQAAKRPQQESSLAVEVIELQNMKAIETGKIDTYA